MKEWSKQMGMSRSLIKSLRIRFYICGRVFDDTTTAQDIRYWYWDRLAVEEKDVLSELFKEIRDVRTVALEIHPFSDPRKVMPALADSQPNQMCLEFFRARLDVLLGLTQVRTLVMLSLSNPVCPIRKAILDVLERNYMWTGGGQYRKLVRRSEVTERTESLEGKEQMDVEEENLLLDL